MEAQHRPRAGTMPSLAVTSTTTRTNVSSLSPNSASSLAFSSSGNLRVLQQQQHLASQPASPAARLEAKPEVASNAGGGARSRSGSLTLPPPIPTPGSTAAFSGFFSGPWTPTVNPQNSSESVRSDESASATDDHLVRTLDYLGLHDTNGANSPPQRDLAAGNRNRANTLAAPPIRRRPSAHLLNNPLDSLPEAQSPQSDQLSITAEQTLAGQQQPLFPLLAPNRPRANTGLPSEPASSSRKRAGTTSLLQSSAAVNMLPNSNLGADDEGSSEGSGYYQANLSSTSSIPLAGSGTNSPSNKSLWVGNLPTQTSLADLYATFGVYGPVESVRFLPERSYAVVNYTASQIAVDAKRDITNRLQGHLWGVPVRLSYGSEVSPASSPERQRSFQGSPSVSTIEGPTRLLRIGPVPPSTSPGDVVNLLGPLAAVDQARLTSGHPRYALVAFVDIETAIRVAVNLGGREIFGPEYGTCQVSFIKGLDESAANAERTIPSTINRPMNISMQPLQAAPMVPNASQRSTSGDTQATTQTSLSELQALLRELSGPEDPSTEMHVQQLAQCAPPQPYFSTIMPPVTDVQLRKNKLEAPYLRELRKRLDSGTAHTSEVDAIAENLLEDAAFLAADYLGNTIIQKFYEKCSFQVKLALLQRIVPHLASIGTNKHGTWAAQKIIDLASSPQEINMICSCLNPYIPPLLLDQFGNYVVQCTLRFGSPAIDGIFDAMFTRCWDIAHGRFGARSMRTVLESPHTSRFQQKRIAVAIIINSVALSMNSNGALLLTWLLETSDLHGRYALLTSRLLPHLPMLCTHKVASNTILRIINQRQDIPAQQAIISSIFDEKTAILEQLLLDQTHGLSMVQRMLASAHIEQSQRSALVTRVRSLLLNLHVDSSPGFTRVLSELAAGNIAAAQPPPRASPIPKKTNHSNRRDRDQQQQPNAHQQVPFGSPGSLTAAQFPMFMQNGAAPGTPTNMRPNLPAGPPGALGLAPPFNVSQQASRPVRSSASGEHGLSLPTSIVPPAYASANGLPFVSDFASPYK